MINPYTCYAVSFLIAIAFYLLGWSKLYPALSYSLLTFLLITCAIHILLAIRSSKKKVYQFRLLGEDATIVWVTLFIYLLWCIEFVYEGGIPLIKILLNVPYNYRLFGVPSLHVFLVTFSSFYTVYLFHLYLSHRKKIIILLYLVNIAAALLIYSRAMLFFNLAASLFLYLLSLKKIPFTRVLVLVLFLPVLFYFFGVLGSLRVSRESKTPYSNEHFLKIGQATDSFQKSILPDEYFWTYMYISSPLANFQTNINTYQPGPFTWQKLGEMINNEILFDFISKRVNNLFSMEREKEHTIQGPFNVSTVYSRSFSYLGWWGVLLMTIVVIILPWGYSLLLKPSSPLFLTGAAILTTMYLFLVYDNTIRFTGLGFQLVYPVVFTVALKIPSIHRIFNRFYKRPQ